MWSPSSLASVDQHHGRVVGVGEPGPTARYRQNRGLAANGSGFSERGGESSGSKQQEREAGRKGGKASSKS
jgi:hypothetical protein